MNRPLIAVLMFYAAGLLFGRLCQPPPGVLPLLFAVSFLILALAIAFQKLRRFLIWPLLMLVGWTNLLLHTAVISPNDLRSLAGTEPALAAIRGKLVETPRLKIIERGDLETEHSLAEVEVTGLELNESWQPAFGKIMVSTPGTPATNFFRGQSVEVSGVIAPPSPPLAEGLFDYRDYLQTRGIYYELKVQSTNDWQLCAPILPHPPCPIAF